MKGLKKIVSAGLLVFIVLSLVYLAVGKEGVSTDRTDPLDHRSGECAEGKSCDGTQALRPVSDATTIVYYLHRTARCRTCHALESNAREAIEKELADELGKGLVVIQSLNVDEAANRHLIQQYQITGPALVLSRTVGGKEVGWKNLDQVWQLIRTPADYQAYVASELKAFMRNQS